MADPRSQRGPDPMAQLQEYCKVLESEATRLRKRVYRLEAIERLRERGRTATMPVQFRSQFGEDTVLWDIFDTQPDGFFIEVGAYDGVSLSVSYAFESVGWKGLLIEALPDRFEQCRKARPNSRVVQAALSKKGSAGTTTFEVVHGDGWAEMFSYHKTTQHHLETVRNLGGTKTQVTVPLTTMNDLLKDHTGPIDFAVIDVEGGELDLLDGFDLHKYKPRVMLIEDNQGSRGTGLPQYMSMFPYTEVGWVGVNRLYVRADEGGILEKLQKG